MLTCQPVCAFLVLQPTATFKHNTMDKIASNASLDAPAIRKIAAYGLAVSLASPVVGLGPDQVKAASAAFTAAMEKSAERHTKLASVLLEHVKAGRSA